jgi:cbb3-type cytochrome oxidase subunit 3
LQASLYTSVVAFGMSILIAVLGVMFILVGYAMLELDKRTTLAVAD